MKTRLSVKNFGVFMLVLALIVGFSLTIDVTDVRAEEWQPERPINAIIMYDAGGGTDRTLRFLATHMQEILDTDITATNMPGAAGAVATEYVYNARPDGYTWLGSAPSGFITYPVLGHLDVDIDDWNFLVGTNSITTITVSYDSDYETMEDLLKDMEEREGEVQLGTAGVGASAHIAGETLSLAGYEYDHVTYPGGHPALISTLQGEVDFTAQHPIEIVDFLESDDLRALAVFDNEPLDIPGQGEVPPITDYIPELEPFMPQGIPFGLQIRRDVPENVMNTIEKAFLEVIKSEEMKEFAGEMGVTLLELTGDESREWHREYQEFLSWLLWEAGAAVNHPDEFGINKPEEFEELF